MKAFQGFLFSKLQAIGTRSEGPGYYMQQFDYCEIPIAKQAEPWREDPLLQQALSTKVSISGKIADGELHYDAINPYSPPTGTEADVEAELPSLKITLIPEAGELWLDLMPPSPPPRPFKITLELEWPYRSIWQGICPTSQLYDFFVEFDGKCIWQWSEGRAFMDVLTPVAIPGGSPHPFTEIWIIEPGTLPAEGLYTIRGLFIASGQEAERQVQIRFAH
ncbi:MAG: hypothetical protein KJ558_00985 [Gammaproteobacteria bacterium]|nr:hypothetical protein [Gammaproteobacteria bacterium]MBU1653410.1 hypothetical protein [Gammaproteobacteria bacterium]MBU1962092.1 hypothetical protein [Gammaproteobacteria bacterium]